MSSTVNTSEKPADAFAPPPGNPRFPLLDSVRALAAIGVVFFHAGQYAGAQNTMVGRAVSHLDVGVAVFFVLTAFLLYRPMIAGALGLAPPSTYRSFYVRRILRIVPAFWVATVAFAAVDLINLSPPWGLPNFAFVQIYRAGWARTGIAPGWSLCVEMSFYLLLPLYMLASNRLWRRLGRQPRIRAEAVTLIALCVASLAFREALQRTSSNPYAADVLPAIFTWFSGGLALALLSVSSWGERAMQMLAEKQAACWGAALALYAALCVASPLGAVDGPLWLFVAYAVLAALFVAPAIANPGTSWPVGRVLEFRPLAWLGLISYGIYLYHYPLQRWFHEHVVGGLPPEVEMLTLGVAGTGAAIACGAVSYYAVERPALRLKRRFGG